MPLAGTGADWSHEEAVWACDDSPRGHALAVDASSALFSDPDDTQDECTVPVPSSPCGCFIPLGEADEIRRLIKSARAPLRASRSN